MGLQGEKLGVRATLHVCGETVAQVLGGGEGPVARMADGISAGQRQGEHGVPGRSLGSQQGRDGQTGSPGSEMTFKTSRGC